MVWGGGQVREEGKTFQKFQRAPSISAGQHSEAQGPGCQHCWAEPGEMPQVLGPPPHLPAPQNRRGSQGGQQVSRLIFPAGAQAAQRERKPSPPIPHRPRLAQGQLSSLGSQRLALPQAFASLYHTAASLPPLPCPQDSCTQLHPRSRRAFESSSGGHQGAGLSVGFHQACRHSWAIPHPATHKLTSLQVSLVLYFLYLKNFL